MLHFLLGTLCSFQGKNDKKLLDTEGYHLISLSTYTDLSKKPYEPLSLWVVPNSCLAHGLKVRHCDSYTASRCTLFARRYSCSSRRLEASVALPVHWTQMVCRLVDASDLLPSKESFGDGLGGHLVAGCYLSVAASLKGVASFGSCTSYT